MSAARAQTALCCSGEAGQEARNIVAHVFPAQNKRSGTDLYKSSGTSALPPCNLCSQLPSVKDVVDGRDLDASFSATSRFKASI
jgi:hypothetical protein